MSSKTTETMAADRPSRRWATTKEAADYTSLSVSYLEKDRMKGGGIPFRRLPTGAIRYDLNEVDAWMDEVS